jgi:hypothetical protein
MKTKLILISIALLGVITNSFSQQSVNWDKWNWLIGEWKGEGSGQPGQGGGTFSFTFDLDKNIIVRNSHSEYPASENRPAVVHDDLMIVYPDFQGIPTKAIYFDNEGHTINYSIAYSEKTIVFLSEKINNAPFFRLTYTLFDNGSVNTKFEMSQDGENFTTYIEGKSEKVQNQ